MSSLFGLCICFQAKHPMHACSWATPSPIDESRPSDQKLPSLRFGSSALINCHMHEPFRTPDRPNMATCNSFYSPPFLIPNDSGRPLRRRIRVHHLSQPMTRIRACARGGDERNVDENMTTLRERIREVGAMDRGSACCRGGLMEGKEYCTRLYDSEACEVVGLLQLSRTGPRPRLTVGVTVMVTVCLPVSVIVVGMHLMDAANAILDAWKTTSLK